MNKKCKNYSTSWCADFECGNCPVKDFQKKKKIEKENISPCPFCGVHESDTDEGTPFLSIESSVDTFGSEIQFMYYVHCSNCGSSGGVRKTEKEAIKLWNLRIVM